MDIRIRVPGGLWRAAVDKFGSQGDLNKWIVQALSDHVNGRASEIARKGGLARTTRMSPEERIELARKAAQARWQGRPDPEPDPDPDLS